MEKTPSIPPKKQRSSLPPRRGRVKAQIFESLAGNLSSAVSKAGQVLAKIKPGSSASSESSTSVSASTSTSPPPSAYTSDGYPDRV